jgi:hypothetical protein
VAIDDAVPPTAFQPWPLIEASAEGDLLHDLGSIIERTTDLPRRQRIDLMRSQLASRLAEIRSVTEDPHPAEQGGTASDVDGGVSE